MRLSGSITTARCYILSTWPARAGGIRLVLSAFQLEDQAVARQAYCSESERVITVHYTYEIGVKQTSSAETRKYSRSSLIEC